MKEEATIQECEVWLNDCLRLFPEVAKRRIKILCTYEDLPKSILGRTKGTVVTRREIDPESLILKGVTKARVRKKMDRTFRLQINQFLRRISNDKLRKQVVKNIIIHELMHVERGDILELGKSYARRKRKRIHAGLEKEAFERYNKLRELEGLPRIKSERDLHDAISKIFEGIQGHQ